MVFSHERKSVGIGWRSHGHRRPASAGKYLLPVLGWGDPSATLAPRASRNVGDGIADRAVDPPRGERRDVGQTGANGGQGVAGADGDRRAMFCTACAALYRDTTHCLQLPSCVRTCAPACVRVWGRARHIAVQVWNRSVNTGDSCTAVPEFIAVLSRYKTRIIAVQSPPRAWPTAC